MGSRPVLTALTARLIAGESPAWPVQMLDVGCSYGMGSAFLKYGCSFEELVSFFESRAPRGYHECAAATRAWLNVARPALEMRVVGLDASDRAIHFATDVGLLDAGISRNLEHDELSESEQAWLAGCNMLICTGAIGYIGKPTFQRVLQHLGSDHPGDFGPVAVMTVLRMFDPSDVQEAFGAAGYAFERVQGVRLPQRGFEGQQEREEVIDAVRARGCDTARLEERGVLYADLYIASRERVQPRLRAAVEGATRTVPIFSRHVEVAHVGSSMPMRSDAL